MMNKFFINNYLVITFDDSRIFVMDVDLSTDNVPEGERNENLVYVEKEIELKDLTIKKLVYCETKIGSYLCNVIGEVKEDVKIEPKEIYLEVANWLSKFM